MRKSHAFPAIPGIEFRDELGRGAHTVVYRGRRDGRDVSIKIQEATPRAEDALRFRREAALLACLRHPALPTVLACGEHEGRQWLALDYAEGRSLAEVLAEGALAEERIVAIARDLAGALAEVHGHGLVHRDVKPANVLITPRDGARLIDFGLAMRLRGEEWPGEVAGTFLYAAPEQTGLLKRQVDGRSDLYALGALLFECAAGHPPFRASDVGELLRQHAVKPVPDLRWIRPDLSQALVRIIEKLLAKDPDDRYQSGKGLLADLLQIDRLAALRDQAILGTRDERQTLFETPVVGYRAERQALRAAFAAAEGGTGSIVLLEGPAGYGKSRLLREMADETRAGSRALVLQARCAPADPAPFGALREAVDGWLRQVRQLPGALREEVERQAAAAIGADGRHLARFSAELAALRPGPAQGGEAELPGAVARFLLALARVRGGVLLVLDDVESLDEASCRVVAQLAKAIGDAPLLLLAAGCPSEPGLQRFLASAGAPRRIALRGLDEEATRELIAHRLGGAEVPDELHRAVSRRAVGAPFAVVESVGAMIDAGLLVPAWGGWQVDTAALEKLSLPKDVTDLFARRLEMLSPQALPILRAAAVAGSGVRVDALARIARVTVEEAEAAIAEGRRANLVERLDRTRMTFVHERVRKELLAELEGDEAASLHLAAAALLEEEPEPRTPRATFALARHLDLGGADAARVYAANLAAGRLALAEGAGEEAWIFLETAQRAATRAGLGELAELIEAIGAAAARSGRFREAVQHLEQAIARSPVHGVERARLSAQLAEVRLALLDTEGAWRAIEAGFRALRRPYPTGGIFSWAISLCLAALGTVLLFLRIGYGSKDPVRREKHKILAALSNLGNRLGFLEGRLGLMAQMTLVPLYSIHRVGRSPELARALASQAMLLSSLGLRWSARALLRKARTMAERLSDRALVAKVRMIEAIAAHVRGESRYAEALHRANLAENASWMEAGDYLQSCNDLAANLLARGHAEKARAIVEDGLVRAGGLEAAPGHPLPGSAAAALAMLGRVQEAAGWLQRLASGGSNRWSVAGFLVGQLALFLEQGETGSQLDEAIARFRSLGFTPQNTPFHRKRFWLLAAWARVAQVERGGSTFALHEALADLRAAAVTPVLRAHALAVEAALALAEGWPDRARTLLAAAEALAIEHDAPWVRYAVLRLRARLVGAADREAGRREASLARALCVELGWGPRAQALARTWVLGPDVGTSQAGTRSERDVADVIKLERQVDALLQVSQACASVLDPDQVIAAALGETVRILGAERALLFLQTQEGELVRAGAEAIEGVGLDDYSRTVVERVRVTRQPLVLSSVEEEADLGAESVVVHELRSVLAVPLLVRDEPVGVLYVDNRLARGMFGRDDMQILAALAAQIGTALETARAAQLEIERQSLERDLEKAFEQATTDALTGLRNRRFLETRIEDELARARRSGRPFSVLLLDVDHFKSVNDTYGHLVGDRVLAVVAGVIGHTARNTDLPARYGGEEFCVLAADTDAHGAALLAERIREAIASQEIPLDDGGLMRVTVSIGVAQVGLHGTDRSQLLAAADGALYEAKESGRNRVRIAAAGAADAA